MSEQEICLLEAAWASCNAIMQRSDALVNIVVGISGTGVEAHCYPERCSPSIFDVSIVVAAEIGKSEELGIVTIKSGRSV